MNRRQFLRLGGGVLLVAGAGLGPHLVRNRKLYRKSSPIMGTIADIQVVHDDERAAFRAIDSVYEELVRLEKLLSYYRSDSEIGQINLYASSKDVAVSAETADLIRSALHWAAATEGSFEPGLGKVISLWDVKHRTEPPSQTEWARLAGRSFFRQIAVTRDHTVRFASDDVRIDLGGIAKGYAADRAIQVLKNEGIEQALVNLGGDVAVLGGRTKDDAWKVGIKDPNQQDEIQQVLHLRDQAVATSGTYEQFFRSAGHVYHHLIDPKIARPGRDGFLSLTVIGNNCRDADALATGLFFLSDARTNKILDEHTHRFSTIRLG